MTPFIVLYYIPIITIIFVIIAIIRLIVRASSNNSSNTNTNYTQYRQPPNTGQNQGTNPYQNAPGTNPYQNSPGTNPYSTNPYNTNPYNTNPTDPNIPPPIDPQQPPTWQNPGTYQQPNYTQPTYNQPNYAPSTYSEPGVNPAGAKRSTNIQSNYATHVGASVPQQKNRTGLIILIVVGVVVLLAGSIVFIAYQRSEGAASLVSESYYLAYENPTENTYYIVLDEWDTITVAPFTCSDDLDYTHRKDLTVFHWQMLDADRNVIADTTVTAEEMESWMYGRTSSYYASSTVLFNPSRTQYVYYTAWFDEIGLDYMDDVQVGDSTYFADAYTVNDPFIFDGRDGEFQTDLENATENSSLDQNQYLISQYDFAVLYHNLNMEDSRQEKMEDYRYQLADLFEVAKQEVLVNSAYDADDVLTCYSLDSMTPSYVDEYTEPRDFIPAIDFVKENARLFRNTAPDQYNYVVDSAEALLKHNYVEVDRPLEFIKMTQLNYTIYEEGILANTPRREMTYENERNTIDATYY